MLQSCNILAAVELVRPAADNHAQRFDESCFAKTHRPKHVFARCPSAGCCWSMSLPTLC
jgi:hypothetical protein